MKQEEIVKRMWEISRILRGRRPMDARALDSFLEPIIAELKSDMAYKKIANIAMGAQYLTSIELKEISDIIEKTADDWAVQRILVLGNGFDLAHGLPTRYDQFLDFCQTVQVLFGESDDSDIPSSTPLIDSLKEIVNRPHSDIYWCYCDEVTKLIHGNMWYSFFHKVILERRGKNDKEKTWIDFESEICVQVKEVEQYLETIDYKKTLPAHKPELLSHHYRPLRGRVDQNRREKYISSFISDMYSDLNRITRALEIYLSVFVQGIPTSDAVQELLPYRYSHILTFNYTDTFEEYYKDRMFSDTEVCHVHGKAEKDHNVSNCNLVLGIDEYLPKKKKNESLTFLQFKKFYQRIYKNTDKRYTEWIEKIRKSADADAEKKDDILWERVIFEVHFFGHSLDVTDKDILRKLILNSNVQTKVFYYRRTEDDKADLSAKIHNLVKVIGQKELIERTSGGEKNTIEFIPQNVPSAHDDKKGSDDSKSD